MIISKEKNGNALTLKVKGRIDTATSPKLQKDIEDSIEGVETLAFDFSEMDLWWLLERKNREKFQHGKVYFYEPFSSENSIKYRLLSCYGAEVVNLGFRLEKAKSEKDQEKVNKRNKKIYKEFYHKALSDIKHRID